MKRYINTSFIKSFCITIGIFLIFFSFLFSFPIKTANAEVFLPTTIADDCFEMVFSANARKSNTMLDKKIETHTTTVGDEISYYVFDWKTISNIGFNFTASFSQSKTFTKYRLKVAHLQTEDLTQSIGLNQDKILFEHEIISNKFNSQNFFYYIDSTATDKHSSNSTYGHDFGIYKFEFSYDYIDSKNTDSDAVITKSLDSLYIAVMPDNIDNLYINKGSKISYSVSSSKLLNIYTLQLSNQDALKYVNPNYFKWQVYGIDKNNVKYCLDSSMQQQIEYVNHKCIWDNLVSTSGQTFILDTNGIEGTWTVELSVKNSDGSEKFFTKIDNLSTIKIPPKSYLWLVFVVAGILIAIGVVVIILVILRNKKHDKVW